MPPRLTPEEKRARTIEANRKLQSDTIRKNIVFSVLSGVMPKSKALQLAGYSPKSKGVPCVIDPGTVQSIRDRLNAVAGCTMADQVGWYVSIREDADVPTSDRMAAAKQIDKVLGYEAPQRVDVSQRFQITGAVAVFHKLLQETGMRPGELARAAEVVEPIPILPQEETQ